MFTFSFSSAFAATQTVGFEAGKDAKELYYAAAYADETGEYGITEAYKVELTDGLQAILDDEATGTDYTLDTAETPTTADDTYNVSSTNYYAPEKATAKAAIEKAITDVKAATTAEAAKKIIDALKTKLDKLIASNATIAGYLDVVENSTEEISFDRLIARYGEDDGTPGQSAYDYYLPGYGLIDKTDVTTTETDVTTLNGSYDFVALWLMDNEYRVDIASGVKALLSALVPVTQTYKDTFNKELVALEDEAYKYADKYSSTPYKNRLTVADLEGIDALLDKINDFNDKYHGYAGSGIDALDISTIADFENGIDSLAGTYFNQYYAEIAALPPANKLDDTKKADIIALYQKVDALGDAYTNVWEVASATTVDGGTTLAAAYNFYKDADVTALTTAATKFTEVKGKDFDNSEANVTALEAARKLYDENVKNYESYNSEVEAKILAAEHNKKAAADFKDEATKIDTSKVQAYLNNATVKVTTKALGNTKIRVNATIDAMSFDYILQELEDGCTVSYQFYHKTAAAKTYKASTVKDRNYITYTSKSLKKGTKYKFQCSVIIKDANGNVVATKDYKASTIGSRVCR